MAAGACYDHHVKGPALISWNYYSGGNLASKQALGYSLDGVRIGIQIFERPIFGDQNGGPEGPPVDYIRHGFIAEVSFVLVDYTEAQLQNLFEYSLGQGLSTDHGDSINAGTLVLGGTTTTTRRVELYLNPINPATGSARADADGTTFTFKNCLWTNPYDFNIGANETQQAMSFRCLQTGASVTVTGREVWTNDTSP